MPKPITIIVYHSINHLPDRCTITPRTFSRQLEFISECFSIIRLSRVRKVLNDPQFCRRVVITFDDAFRDFYEFGYPLLKKYKIPSTVFVPTGYIGRVNYWDYPFHKNPKKSLMDKKQLRELNRSGLVDFGSHSINHSRMSKLSPEENKNQAAGSKETLEDLLSTPITMFSYPYGRVRDISPLISQVLSETGYQIGVTTLWGTKNSMDDILRLRRIYLKEKDSLNKIKAKIMGHYDWLPFMKEKVWGKVQSFRKDLDKTFSGRKGKKYFLK